ncbi:Serine protease filzig like protein [Argiope bruennichi]|uniref:Serine protease filzig like protein n=2 Tax=Argiope bruennichi TaxID=94029 RepID=A0A8T0FNC1_ARGBR|nr:Serine protease filzig like protein [Argiope bruennichi]
MVMTKKSCQDPLGNKGTCMFKYDCIRQKGVTLSTCVDGFLFGACCFLKEESIQIISDDVHSVNYKGQNETIYNFYQIESEAPLNNSTEPSLHLEDISNASFNNFSNKNFQEHSSTNVSDLFYSSETKQSTTIDLSIYGNNFTTFKNVLHKQVHNTTHIPSAAVANFSKSLVSESITFFTRPIDYNEKIIMNNESSSLSPTFQNSTRINNSNVLPEFPSSTESHSIPVSESSEKVEFEEYRNKLTSISHFDNSNMESSTADTINLFNEEQENSTALNKSIFSDLNSTDSSTSTDETVFQDILVTTEKPYEMEEPDGLINENLPFDYNYLNIQSSQPTDSYMVSSFQINFLTISENNSTNVYNSTNESGYENFVILNKNFTTEPTQNTVIFSTIETPSIQTNSEPTNFEVLTVSQDYPKLTELEEEELLNANITSSNFGVFENTTFYDGTSTSPNNLTEIFNSKASNSNIKSFDKKTTKSDVLPSLPWSSNSILPESFQSVISQLIEKEVSSPENFILNYETHATPAVDVNTLVDQSLFLDSEENLNMEFKSHNISGFVDENFFSSELDQDLNTKFPDLDNFTFTPSPGSSITLNVNKFDDVNKNILLIPNVFINDLAKNEINVTLSVNLSNDVSPKDELEITSNIYNIEEIPHTVEDFTLESEGEKTEVGISTSSSLGFLTEQNKVSESNLNSYMDEILLSAQTEAYTFPTTVFQDSSNQEKNNIQISTLQLLDQSFSEPITSFPNVQSQSLDNSLYNATEVSATLPEEAATNSYPTVIQIINNHTGKNSSAINFLNHMRDSNESFVSTIFAQSEKTGIEENATIYPIVNNGTENRNDLYEIETFINTSTPIILNVENFEESQLVDSSTHLVVSSDISNSFNESVDSSQSISSEILSSYTDFNSTNTFPSVLIDNLTSPLATIIYDDIKDMDFEEQYLTHTDGQSIENTDDFHNMIFAEDEHSTGYVSHLDENSDHTISETKSTQNIILFNYTDENSDDGIFVSHITTELSNAETSEFTTKNTEISETVLPSALTSLSDMNALTDTGKPPLPISSLLTDLSDSDTSIATSSTDIISSTISPYATITQSLNFPTHGDVFPNTSHELSVIHSTGNTTLSTLSTLKSPSIQDAETTNPDEFINLSTQAYSRPIPVTTTAPKVDVQRWNYKKDCGVRLMPVGRIVGGKNTFFGKWPWQALVKEATWLGLFVKNKCGGVLITSKYVLTAAHCQPGFLASLLVVLGTHDLAETFDNKASIIRNVKRMVVHRHYNAQTFENDLALLEMEAPVEFLPYVVPICLPHRNEDFTGKMAFVTGWGKLTAGGDVPNILQEVQVPIVTNGECQRMFYQAGHQKAIRSNFVCAGYTNGGQDSCEGDSGGPLMVQREDTRWVLVGTVSHGIGCADPNLPGVYMRMSSYRPWIDSIIYK